MTWLVSPASFTRIILTNSTFAPPCACSQTVDKDTTIESQPTIDLGKTILPTSPTECEQDVWPRDASKRDDEGGGSLVPQPPTGSFIETNEF